MEAQIGRLEAHVEHIQFDVTDLRQDMKTVLREIRGHQRETARPDQSTPEKPGPMNVTLHAFPDIGLIVKAATGVLYSNQAGGFACLHPEVEGFFVPLRTPFGMRELNALQDLFPSGFDAEDGMDEETAERIDRLLTRQGLKCIRVDRSKLAESWEAWVHVTVSGELDYKVPLEGATPARLEAVLTWPNSD